MKKTVLKEVHYCDACDKQQDYIGDPCFCCGKEHCYECKKKLGKEYKHGVYMMGSGDGYYCNDCDSKLTKAGTDKRHAAYRKIASLQLEFEGWHANFQRRQKAAEKELTSYES